MWRVCFKVASSVQESLRYIYCVLLCCRMANQLGLTQMITIEIKIPNRMVGLGECVAAL